VKWAMAFINWFMITVYLDGLYYIMCTLMVKDDFGIIPCNSGKTEYCIKLLVKNMQTDR
jgi:hypothetical protein